MCPDAYNTLLIKLAPLSNTEIPGKDSRRVWFANVEQPLKLLDHTFLLEVTEHTICNIGPMILGPLAWDQIITQPFADWTTLKRVISIEFRYSKE